MKMRIATDYQHALATTEKVNYTAAIMGLLKRILYKVPVLGDILDAKDDQKWLEEWEATPRDKMDEIVIKAVMDVEQRMNGKDYKTLSPEEKLEFDRENERLEKENRKRLRRLNGG